MASKRLPSETRIARGVEQILVERLPSGRSIRPRTGASSAESRIDLLVEITSPSGERAVLAIEIKQLLEPRLVPEAAEQISMLATEALPAAVPLIATAYLSPRSREILDDLGIGYMTRPGTSGSRGPRLNCSSRRWERIEIRGLKTAISNRHAVAARHGR